MPGPQTAESKAESPLARSSSSESGTPDHWKISHQGWDQPEPILLKSSNHTSAKCPPKPLIESVPMTQQARSAKPCRMKQMPLHNERTS